MPAANTTAGVGFSLTVTEVTDLSTEFDSRQDVKKRIGNILYLHNPPPDSVLLAYAGSDFIQILVKQLNLSLYIIILLLLSNMEIY